jgi:hypothetical protein
VAVGDPVQARSPSAARRPLIVVAYGFADGQNQDHDSAVDGWPALRPTGSTRNAADARMD